MELVVLLLVLSGTIMAVLSISAFQRRSSQVAFSFAVSCLCAAVWDFGFAAEIISPMLGEKIFWANLQFLGISFLPVAWLSMTLITTAKPRQAQRIIPFLGLIPLVTNLIIWTDPSHHLFRLNPHINSVNVPFPVLVSNYGPFFYAVHAPYGYVLFAISLFLLIHAWRKASAVYRQQRLMLVLSLLFPLLIDFLYVTGISPIPAFNFTSIIFSISGLLIGINILSFHFLDVVPLAYEAAINEMNVGVIVLDSFGRVSHMNPAAERITSIVNDKITGYSARQEIHQLEPLWSSPNGSAEITIQMSGDARTYQFQTTEITNKSKQVAGEVVTINDITERVSLHRQVEELSITDELTEALNRRALNLYGEREILAANRYGRDLSIVMLDIDNFKEINDRFGHQFGDEVLRAVVKSMKKKVRVNDLVFRYGGDEFILFLIETDKDEAFKTAVRIREELAHLSQEFEESLSSGVLVSMGITGLGPDDNLETMLHRADRALYRAKADGKNKIVVEESNA
ncbi:MAG: histidine kinase N-terminal 7TM domain-containing protein [Anaerolineaceae bacterium]